MEGCENAEFSPSGQFDREPESCIDILSSQQAISLTKSQQSLEFHTRIFDNDSQEAAQTTGVSLK